MFNHRSRSFQVTASLRVTALVVYEASEEKETLIHQDIYEYRGQSQERGGWRADLCNDIWRVFIVVIDFTLDGSRRERLAELSY